MRSLFVLFGLATTRAQWTKLTPANTPAPRTVAGFTEIEGGGVLLFGGSPQSGDCGGGGGAGIFAFCNDTWIFQHGEWTDVSHLGPAPSGRCLFDMAPYGDGVVLFGGYTMEKMHANDTWIWSPSNGWREVQTPVAPPARNYHTMSSIGGRAMLFGGTNRESESQDSAFGDTWMFDDKGWTDLGVSEPNAPRARWGHGLACNEAVILPGVNDGSPGACVLTGGAANSEDDHFQDTWMYTQAGWKQSQPGTSHPHANPAGRWSFTMAPCGLGAMMATGSIGYRIETSDTWTFNFTHFPSKWTTEEINHDAYGEWRDYAGTENIGELGGAMLARIRSGSHQGVLLFGGTPMDQSSGGWDPKATWLWPETDCPGGSSAQLAPIV